MNRSTRPVSRSDEMMARFDRADRNGDGRIARNEWTGTTAASSAWTQTATSTSRAQEFLADSGRSGERCHVRRRGPRNTTRAYLSGYDRGRSEGRQAGKEDKGVNGGHWDLEGQRELEQADSGYTADFVHGRTINRVIALVSGSDMGKVWPP